MENKRKIVMAIPLLAMVAALGWLSVKFANAGKAPTGAATGDAAACERETGFPQRGTQVSVKFSRLENGNYRTVLELRSDNDFDTFVQSDVYDPPLVSPAGQRVLQVRKEPLTVELAESATRGLRIARKQSSYANLTDQQVRAASTANPVTGRYPLSAASMVTQVNGDHVKEGSHFTAEGMGEAVDLQAPEGTEVVAFGAGTVVHVEGRFDDTLHCVRGHSSIHANKVVVLQDDGYEARYGHLKKGSILVTEGMRVAQGQPLARLGEFDASDVGSHLHFQVGGMTEPGLISLPVAFEHASGGAAIVPKVGQRIQP